VGEVAERGMQPKTRKFRSFGVVCGVPFVLSLHIRKCTQIKISPVPGSEAKPKLPEPTTVRYHSHTPAYAYNIN